MTNLCESCRFYGGTFNGYALCNAPEAAKLMDAPKDSCKHHAPKEAVR